MRLSYNRDWLWGDWAISWQQSDRALIPALPHGRGKIATGVRLVANRAREWEDVIEPHQLHFQLRHRFDVARHER